MVDGDEGDKRGGEDGLEEGREVRGGEEGVEGVEEEEVFYRGLFLGWGRGGWGDVLWGAAGAGGWMRWEVISVERAWRGLPRAWIRMSAEGGFLTVAREMKITLERATWESVSLGLRGGWGDSDGKICPRVKGRQTNPRKKLPLLV